jgi:predicted transcriptional regulator YheO
LAIIGLPPTHAKKFQPFLGVAEAIANLLHPFAEVVIHDHAEGRIRHIWNSFSGRSVGDRSETRLMKDLRDTGRTEGIQVRTSRAAAAPNASLHPL